MKIVIAGSRGIPVNARSFALLAGVLRESGWGEDATEVIVGMAAGVDQIGIEWAVSNDIPWRGFPANWSEQGRAAGPIRNREMGEAGDCLVALRVGGTGSRGTTNMIETMTRLGKPVYVVEVSAEQFAALSAPPASGWLNRRGG